MVNSVRRSELTEIRIEPITYQGRQLIEIRVWVKSNSKLSRTKRGFTLPCEAYPDFVRMVVAVAKALEEADKTAAQNT
jgi:hypothetical protein